MSNRFDLGLYHKTLIAQNFLEVSFFLEKWNIATVGKVFDMKYGYLSLIYGLMS